MKVLTTIRLPGSQGGSGRIDPIDSGLPRMAIRGRPFLSERGENNRSRYYKGAISEAERSALRRPPGAMRSASPRLLRPTSHADLPLQGEVTEPVARSDRAPTSLSSFTFGVSHRDKTDLLSRLPLALDFEKRKRPHRLPVAARMQRAERLAHRAVFERAMHRDQRIGRLITQ